MSQTGRAPVGPSICGSGLLPNGAKCAGDAFAFKGSDSLGMVRSGKTAFDIVPRLTVRKGPVSTHRKIFEVYPQCRMWASAIKIDDIGEVRVDLVVGGDVYQFGVPLQDVAAMSAADRPQALGLGNPRVLGDAGSADRALTCPEVGHFFGQNHTAKRAEHHFVADHVGGGAGNRQFIGKLIGFRKRRLNFGILHLLAKVRLTGAKVHGNAHGLFLAGPAWPVEHLTMEIRVFVGMQGAEGHRNNMSPLRIRSQNRKLFQGKSQFWVFSDHLIHVGHGAFAETAIVIEKLHDRDLAIGISDDPVVTGVEYLTRLLGDCRRPRETLFLLLSGF